MFPCLFQLVLRFLLCLEWPTAHTQLTVRNLVTALKVQHCCVTVLSASSRHCIRSGVLQFHHYECAIGIDVFLCPHSSRVSDPAVVPHGPLQTPLSGWCVSAAKSPCFWTCSAVYWRNVSFTPCTLSLIMFFSLCLHRLSREETWEASYRANTASRLEPLMSYVSFSCCVALPFPAAIRRRRSFASVCLGFWTGVLDAVDTRPILVGFNITGAVCLSQVSCAHVAVDTFKHRLLEYWHYCFFVVVESGEIYSRQEMLNCGNKLSLWNMNKQTYIINPSTLLLALAILAHPLLHCSSFGGKREGSEALKEGYL